MHQMIVFQRRANMFHDSRIGLRGIAIFEAFKGILVLTIGFGLIFLNIPSHYFPHAERLYHFLRGLNYWMVGLAALIYATVRFVEAYGLWRDRAWAEWMAIISTAIYLPLEFYEVFEKQGLIRILIT